ncbi:MAG: rRNA maturation RNase YbeY [Cyanobacteria bacterium P01_A01_bin.45]
MLVETYVQDDFYQSFVLEISNQKNHNSTVDCIGSYVTSQDWQDWFNSWLVLLNSTKLDWSSPSINTPSINSSSAYEVGLRLTNDREIQDLNSLYRHQDKPTDVLAFAALEADIPQPIQMSSSTPIYLGDIVISVTTAYKQAREQNHSLKVEIAWLATHGLLHLLGWDHPDEESLDRMLKQQVILLKTLSIYINI